MDKRLARRELFARIRNLTIDERSTHSAAIRAYLAKDETFQKAAFVFSFLSLPGEPDLSPLVSAFPEKRWAFSRVTSEGTLAFHEMTDPSEASVGDHGIREPDLARHREVSPLDADYFLVPGVGFDPISHARLGRGRGHYDRYLSLAGERPVPAVRVGVAFSTQYLSLEPEAHDIPMHHVLSELGWS